MSKATRSPAQKPILSTGDIPGPYEIIDVIFAAESGVEIIFIEPNPERAFTGVKDVLREQCRERGGHAVINCRFKLREVVDPDRPISKRSMDIFAYGTVVRLIHP